MAKTIYVQNQNSVLQPGNTVKISDKLTASVSISRSPFDKFQKDEIFIKSNTLTFRKTFDIDKDFQFKPKNITQVIDSYSIPASKRIDSFGNLTSITKLVYSDSSEQKILQVKNNHAEKFDINSKEELISKLASQIREDDILTFSKKYSDINFEKNSNETIFKPINGVTEFKIDYDIFDDISDGISPDFDQDISIFKQDFGNTAIAFDTDANFDGGLA